jgi:tetratricopeptide (TPR) repeat protein
VKPTPSTTGTDALQAAFDAAIALHKAGQVSEALARYEALRDAWPANPQLLYLLGASYVQLQRPADAIAALECSLALQSEYLPALEMIGSALIQTNAAEKSVPYFRKAAELSPASAEALVRLAGALQRCDRHDEAMGAYEKARAIEPGHRQAPLGLAISLAHLGKAEDAEALLRLCVRQHPDYDQASSTLATFLGGQERYAEAEDALRAYLAAAPGHAKIYRLLANTLHKQGRFAEAETEYRRALELTPHDASTLIELGEALLDLHRADEAEASFQDARRIQPRTATAITGLGRVAELRGDLATAIGRHNEAIACDPRLADGYVNRGNARRFSGDFDGALADYDSALSLRPAFAAAIANRGTTLLTLGRFGEAWPEYRSRIRARAGSLDLSGDKPWDGSALTGKRVMVWAEYGLGDEILFASLLPDLLTRVAHCTFVCSPRLRELFARSFPAAAVVALGNPIMRDFDVRMSLTDVAQWLRPTLASFPRHNGYVKAEPALTEILRKRYRGKSGNRVVGISWRSASGATGRFKSCNLTQWAGILSAPDTTFVSLQYGDVDLDIERAAVLSGKEIIVDRSIESAGDLDAFAAQVAAMDLVISVSNTTVHVAGALARPVWVLTPTGPGAHWYWFRDRADNPWYPSARLFRQAQSGDWSAPLADIAVELRA